MKGDQEGCVSHAPAFALSAEALALDAPGWVSLREGVKIRELHSSQGLRIALLSYVPGAYVPKHTHTGDEHIFVIQGSQSDENGHHHAGSYVFNPTGSCHSVHSRVGCLVLIHWRGPVAFIDENHHFGMNHDGI